MFLTSKGSTFGLALRAAPYQPHHCRWDKAHDQHGRDGKHEVESRPVDDDIARQVEQGRPLEPRSRDAGDDEYDSERYEKSVHYWVPSTFAAVLSVVAPARSSLGLRDGKRIESCTGL